MRRNYRMYRRTHSPFGYVLFGLLLMSFFGWKLFFLFPFFMMLAFWGTWARAYRVYEWEQVEMEKPKGKPKNDWNDIDYA